MNGGDGNDTISAAGGGNTGNPFTTSVTLAGGNGNDKLTGGKGADVVDGGPNNDTFTEVKTPDGSDTLIGGARYGYGELRPPDGCGLRRARRSRQRRGGR